MAQIKDAAVRALLPLTPAVLHILLSLAAADRHGLGIAADVKEFSGGRLVLGPGTLYGTVKRLLEIGMIQDLGQPSSDDDPRRRYYRITPLGRRALELETEGMQSIVSVARRRRVLRTS
jgi:DNA-binding PadR family transcriptional regulator